MHTYFNGITNTPEYRVVDDVQILRIKDKNIAVNPENGGWAVLSDTDLIQLFSPNKILQENLGEKAYSAGIARRNGSYVFDSERVSHSPGKLYFFEFNLCSACNLKCLYCSSETSTEQMKEPDVSVGKLWIDRVFEYVNQIHVPRITLEFTGGEPLVNVDFMGKVCAYAYEKFEALGTKIDLIFSTNLTVLGEKQIDFIKKFRPRIQVSFDGPEEIQNLHRPFPSGRGSYDVVRSNLNLLKQVDIQCNTLASVVTAQSVQKMPEIAKFILDLGIEQMTLQPMNAVGQGRNMLELMPEPALYAEKLFETADKVILPYWEKTKRKVHVRHLGIVFAYLLQPWRNYMCQRCPCGNSSSIISTDANGNVYGCNQAPFNEDTILGNIKDNSFTDCQKSINALAFTKRNLNNIQECSRCAYKSFCQGGCPKSAITLYGTVNAPGDACKLNKALFTRAFERILDDAYPLDFIKSLAHSYMSVNKQVR